LKRAAGLGDRLLEEIPKFILESETDSDLVLRTEAFYRNQGHPGLSRTRGFNMETLYGHLIAGPSGARPSATPGPTAGTGIGPYLSQGAAMTKLIPHTPILVDYTANVEGYLSDQTRIFSIGALPEKLQAAHETMIAVQTALAGCRMPVRETSWSRSIPFYFRYGGCSDIRGPSRNMDSFTLPSPKGLNDPRM
jgi:Xaa-Pro aminopeptidase